MKKVGKKKSVTVHGGWKSKSCEMQHRRVHHLAVQCPSAWQQAPPLLTRTWTKVHDVGAKVQTDV